LKQRFVVFLLSIWCTPFDFVVKITILNFATERFAWTFLKRKNFSKL